MYSQTTILGNVGQDPEMRFTKDGTAVTSFSVAVSKKWKSASGQPQEQTTWYRVSAWDKLAEPCATYLKKGKQVMVVGEIQQPNVWTDREGVAKASLEIRAQVVKFLGGKGDNETPAANVNNMPDSLGDVEMPF